MSNKIIMVIGLAIEIVFFILMTIGFLIDVKADFKYDINTYSVPLIVGVIVGLIIILIGALI